MGDEEAEEETMTNPVVLTIIQRGRFRWGDEEEGKETMMNPVVVVTT